MHKQKKILKSILAMSMALVLSFSCVVSSAVIPARASILDALDIASWLADATDEEIGEFVWTVCNKLSKYSFPAIENYKDFIKCHNAAVDSVGSSDYESYYTEFVNLWTGTYGHTESELPTVLDNLYSVLEELGVSGGFSGVLSAALKNIGFYCSSLNQFSLAWQLNPVGFVKGIAACLECAVNGTTTLANKFFGGSDISSDNLVDDPLESSDSVEVSSEFMEDVKEACDDYIEEYAGYYLYPSITPDDIQPSWFGYKANYNWNVSFYKDAVSQFDAIPMYFQYNLYTGSYYKLYLFFEYLSTTFLSGFYVDSSDYVYGISDSWSSSNYSWAVNVEKSSDYYQDYSLTLDPTYEAYKTFVSSYKSGSASYSPCYLLLSKYSSAGSSGYWCFVTSDGHSVKVWKSIDGYKNYSCGKQTVYTTTSYTNYSPTSVTYSGDYINNSDISLKLPTPKGVLNLENSIL